MFDGEAHPTGPGLDLPRPPARGRRTAIRDRPVTLGEPGGVLTVDADDLRSGDLCEVAVEPVDDGGKRAEVVEVVGLDVGEDRAVERQLQEGAVALVGLDDEQVATRPSGAGPEIVHVATDDEVRVEPGGVGDGGEHRGRRRLAVRAGHRHRGGPRADRGEHAGPPQDRDASGAGGGQLDVAGGDRRRCRDSVDAMDHRRVMSDRHVHPDRPQPVDDRAPAGIAAGDRVAHLGEHRGDRVHARPGDPDHVVAARARQIERGDRRADGRGPGHDGRPTVSTSSATF